MMVQAAISFALSFVLGGGVMSTASPANDKITQVDRSCSIHIWQHGIYLTDSASNLGAFGLIGAVLKEQYDRKYPAASVEGVIEDVLNIQALPITMASVPWRSYTGVERNEVVFEHNVVTDSKLKELKMSATCNSSAQDSCYIELYIGTQTFSGGGIKSHLFSDFYARTFYDKVQSDKGALLFKQTPHLSVKDVDSLIEAKRIIADGFMATLTKFLSNKLPKRSMPS